MKRFFRKLLWRRNTEKKQSSIYWDGELVGGTIIFEFYGVRRFFNRITGFWEDC